MLSLKNLSIRNKILFSICGAFLVIFSLGIFLLVNFAGEMATRSAVGLAEQLAANNAKFVKSEIERAMTAARTMSHVYQSAAVHPGGANRDLLDNQLRQVLLSHPSFFGAWVLFEPNALDGRDSQFANYNDTHDASGRYGIYHFREDGEITSLYAAPEEGDEPGDSGDWYQLPKRNRAETLMDPYRDQDAGKLMTTVSVPIVRDDTFIGAVGIDIELATIQEMVGSIKVFETGYAQLLANNGEIVAQSGNRGGGNGTGEGQEMASADVFQAVKAGKELVREEMYVQNGEKLLRIYQPVVVGESTTPWSFVVSIPMREILAESRAIIWKATAGGLCIILVLAGIIFALTTRITSPLQKVEAMIQGLADGNLDCRLEIASGDEVGRMAQAMNVFADNMRDEVLGAFNKLAAGDFTFEAQGVIRDPLAKANHALRHFMGQVKTVGEQIASGSSQVSEASQVLSQGATDQASTMEEISASMADVGLRVRQSAESATRAASLVNTARQAADRGSIQMRQMVEAMGEIDTASQNISKIIRTIDDIAFQTNLLALNAAVEAARCGQQGKGFAVVAEEVRNLAARSAKAARETAGLIEGSVAKTRNGAVIADQTAEALSEIVDGVSRAADLVAEIAMAVNEQAQGIAQVNQGLGRVDQVMQQNMTSAELTAGTAAQLSYLAEQLRQMLSRFHIEGQKQTMKNRFDETGKFLPFG